MRCTKRGGSDAAPFWRRSRLLARDTFLALATGLGAREDVLHFGIPVR
jgi:hypothetical protein